MSRYSLDYPNEPPNINIISIDVPAEEKTAMVDSLKKTCEDYIGMAMTYVLSSELGSLMTDHHKGFAAKAPVQSV